MIFWYSYLYNQLKINVKNAIKNISKKSYFNYMNIEHRNLENISYPGTL